MSSTDSNTHCPCKRIKCKRYGQCEACRAHHLDSKYAPACEHLKEKKQHNNNNKEK